MHEGQMSRSVARTRFKRLAGLAAVVAASLIAYATYHHLMSGGDTESVPISVFVGLAAIVGSAVNQPFRTDDGSMELCLAGIIFCLEVLSGGCIRIGIVLGLYGWNHKWWSVSRVSKSY